MLSGLQPFTVDDLPLLINSFGYHTEEEVKEQKSTVYFSHYLGNNGLKANYSFTETDYVNRDYLLDYSEFYSKCFNDKYRRKCNRIHFFRLNTGLTASNELWRNAIRYPDINKNFWGDAYLGFIVIKPIPYSLIGYSILQHFNYSDASPVIKKTREFWSKKSCRINLFGVEIVVDSLPFIQQDSVLAACASVAIWTIFQKASDCQFVIQKSPGQITKDAAEVSSDGGRLIPNDGLVLPDMCKAITKNGLDTVVYNNDALAILDKLTEKDLRKSLRKELKNSRTSANQEFCSRLKKIVYAYSDLGNPIILGLGVPRGEESAEHAVAIGGHNLEETTNGSIWIADRIDKLYVHDDQLGPFSKIRFKSDGQLITAWDQFQFAEKNNLEFNLEAAIPDDFECTNPLALIVPIFPKVRLTYYDIEDIVVAFHDILTDRLGHQWRNLPNWDVKVKYSKKFKTELRESGVFDLGNESDFELLTNVLVRSMPRYIWNAIGWVNGKRVFDLVFDATDFSNGILCEAFYCYVPEIFEEIKKEIESNMDSMVKKYSVVDKPFRRTYLKFFCENSLMSAK